jgi:hypothetical protein
VSHAWESFYFLVGSAAVGLIGLLFVVVTLTAGFERSRALIGSSIYMTPTVLHFAVVLAISAVAIAPGLTVAQTASIFGVAALVGLGHAIRSCVGIAARRPGMDPPHWSDFWLYGGAPATIYLGLCAASVGLWNGNDWAADAIGALLLALLLLGIRNAWDLVTWIAPRGKGGGE